MARPGLISITSGLAGSFSRATRSGLRTALMPAAIGLPSGVILVIPILLMAAPRPVFIVMNAEFGIAPAAVGGIVVGRRHLFVGAAAKRALRGQAIHAAAASLPAPGRFSTTGVHPFAFAARRRDIARGALVSISSAVVLTFEIATLEGCLAAAAGAGGTFHAVTVIRAFAAADRAFSCRLIMSACATPPRGTVMVIMCSVLIAPGHG